MSSLIRWLDDKFYPNERGAWDNARYRALVLPLLKSTDRVLDLGAGRGRIPEMNLKGLVREVVGIDPDPCVLENPYLDKAVHASNPKAPLPFEDSSFDLVITSNVLEHVDAPTELFREVRRVLKPGGLFVNKTPNSGHYVALIASLTPHWFHEWVNAKRGRVAADTYPTYYRANSRRAIETLCRGGGFDVVQIARWEGPPNYLRILPPVYALGILYERVVNSSASLGHFRAVLASVLRKSV
jgi:SAM-dependent methyltransferase